MRDVFFDLETHSRVNLKTEGSHKYARDCEVMIFAFADGDNTIYVWDMVHDELWWEDELSGTWESKPVDGIPAELMVLLEDEDVLWVAHNSGQFDFPVLDNQRPDIAKFMAHERRRDTMVQAFSHALPGALEKLGDILNLTDDKKKIKDGKMLVRLLCLPQNEAFVKKFGTDRATRDTHPGEWMRFIQYAGGDIVTMREVRRRLPQWNYSSPKQIELCLIDWRINARGFQVDTELAAAAVAGADKAKAAMAKRTKELTDDAVESTTQRDVLLAHILAAHGVELPDMRADTLERRVEDPDLPEAVRELLKIRLQASMNSITKFKVVLRAVCADGRMRGCMQFRGAGRTGRWAHRLVQPGNYPRSAFSHQLVEFAIDALKADDTEVIDMVLGNIMLAISSSIRGMIIAPPGKKLVIADLANIEGRMAAWLAGEEWKLQAFRDYDTIIGKDEKGKPIRKGHDLYILSYANSFNVPPESVPPKGDERQIGKVEELMFQYGGGVGAWLTGAATYGIKLDAMTEQVYETIPRWALEEAENFWTRTRDKVEEKFKKRLEKTIMGTDAYAILRSEIETEKNKATFNLTKKVFTTCDAIKRLWRKAHPQISSYWKELEDAVRFAIENQGVTVECRKLKVRRKGGWLRIGLPSGRCLCYPEPRIEPEKIPSERDPSKMIANPHAGKISFVGPNVYTRQWGRVYTHGPKVFENAVQAASCDQFAEPMPMIEEAGFDLVLGVHDEHVAEAPADRDDLNAEHLGRLMCARLDWNEGLPLAAAGFEDVRYRKE
jgi:DNA polymerase bacteriophage-type